MDYADTTEMPQRGKRIGRPWTKETAPPGRLPGTRNKIPREVRKLCLELLEDAKYKATFLESWQERKVSPQIEAMIWAYAHGKPKETIELKTKDQAPFMALINQLPPEEQKRLGEAMATLFRAKLKAGDVTDVEAAEVE